MGSQEFCLKWNNHHMTLVSVLDRLLSSETLVDVTLVAEGKSIRVHRVVLAACSTYFHDIVDLHQDKSLVIFLKDVKYVELQALVDYMYRGEVRVAQNSLASLIRTAESLKIKGLAEAEDESNPIENETHPPDRDTHSPVRKRRRRSGESYMKKDSVPPAPPLQPAPVIQINEDDSVVPVTSTPRVVKQVPPPPPLAPAIEHSSELKLEKNSGDFVKEYISSNLEDSNHHGPSPVLPKLELSGDELGNDTDHGQEEEWNEEDFSALVSDQTGNSETGETSRSLQNNSQQGFQCGICLRQYKYIRNLRKHQKYECGGRKCFVCAACGKTFSQKQHVEEHKKRKHPDNNMQINQAPSDTDENTREKGWTWRDPSWMLSIGMKVDEDTGNNNM
ncbi:zinc finger and BTB domain-containing protein 14-like isoform X5 [Artemia franciscana]|uniref:zinc finger and BTB domain-containing protein 14-like isoform X5 n=1 Tax=Artemia franciscana TaxID=6661 RepID=UPI0032DBC6D4